MGCVQHPEVESGLEQCDRCGNALCGDCFVVLRDRPFCASCREQHVRDLRSGLRPGVLDLASIGRRFVGMWLDGIVTAIGSYAIVLPIMVPAMALGGASGKGEPSGAVLVLSLLTYPIYFLVPVAYEAVMLQRRGQTLGKMALGVRVVAPDGGPISRGQAWTRAAFKVLLGGCLGIGYLPALLTRERTCRHDLIARTRVTRVPA
jgi:uncharacterized RDD family membrane protein YckC